MKNDDVYVQYFGRSQLEVMTFLAAAGVKDCHAAYLTQAVDAMVDAKSLTATRPATALDKMVYAIESAKLAQRHIGDIVNPVRDAAIAERDRLTLNLASAYGKN